MDKNKRYLFVYFTGETKAGEQIYFALSEDGLHWKDLNCGMPVLRSDIGEKGVRDPFILRSRLDGRFYIMATDLRIASGKGWDAARERGSRKIIFWSSGDLIRWSRPDAYEVQLDGAGSVWAPKACYDKSRGEYMVFWASLTQKKGDEEPRFRIYCSFTKDFRAFSVAQEYMEKENSVIDMIIVEEAGKYYRFIKDAATGGLVADCGTDLQGQFLAVPGESLKAVTGVEGPLAFLMPDGKTWCLMADRFAQQLGYLPMLCKDLGKGNFRILKPEEYDLGQNRKRHGSVLEISEEEYERLCLKYQVQEGR